MAVSFDAVGPGSTGKVSGAAPTSVSWSHTCGSGANRAVYVGISVAGVPTTGMTATATYGGSAMTSLGRINSGLYSDSENYGFIQIFRLLNPPTGAATVVVTPSSAPSDVIIGGSISFTGVNQTEPETQRVYYNGGNSPNGSLTVNSAQGNMLLDIVCNGTQVVSSLQTLQWLNNNDNTNGAGNAAQSTAPGGGPVEMGYAMYGNLGFGDNWAWMLIEICGLPVPATWITA